MPVLTARSNGKNEILLEWTVPAGNGSTITDYDLQRWDPGTNTAQADGLASLLMPPDAGDGDLLGCTSTGGYDVGNAVPHAAYRRHHLLLPHPAQNGGHRVRRMVDPQNGADDSTLQSSASATTDTDVPGRVAWVRLMTIPMMMVERC